MDMDIFMVQYFGDSWKAWILTGLADRQGYFNIDRPGVLSSPTNSSPYACTDLNAKLKPSLNIAHVGKKGK